MSQGRRTWLTRYTRSKLWFQSNAMFKRSMRGNISRRDKEIHENKVCDFRRVKCDYCGQMVLYKNFMQHTCKHTCEMKAELREVRSKQDEMFKMMQNMMSSLTAMRNTPQRSEGSHASSGQEMQAEIVVAGGYAYVSLSKCSTWQRKHGGHCQR